MVGTFHSLDNGRVISPSRQTTPSRSPIIRPPHSEDEPTQTGAGEATTNPGILRHSKEDVCCPENRSIRRHDSSVGCLLHSGVNPRKRSLSTGTSSVASSNESRVWARLTCNACEGATHLGGHVLTAHGLSHPFGSSIPFPLPGFHFLRLRQQPATHPTRIFSSPRLRTTRFLAEPDNQSTGPFPPETKRGVRLCPRQVDCIIPSLSRKQRRSMPALLGIHSQLNQPEYRLRRERARPNNLM